MSRDADVMAQAIELATAPLRARIEALERAAPRDGRDGLPGVPGPAGEKGRDGTDGKDGLHGKDGTDGLGFDDLEAEYDEHGRLSIKFVRGDVVKRFRVPGIVYRKLWMPNESYLRGDTVTWGGGQWTALQDNDGTVKPGDGEDVWKLSVMRGKQGEKGLKGERGADGADGRPGRDLNQRW